MIRHHIQNAILYSLSFADGIRFSDLKPNDLENKLFDYHLKQLVRDGLVIKNEDGGYSLSTEGKRLGRSVFSTLPNQSELARSVLFLVVRRKSDSSWLLYQRKTHPLKDRVGFIHCAPEIDKSILETAKNNLQLIGLKGDFKILGGGFFRGLDDNQVVESFTNFSLLVCDNAEGDIRNNDDRASYFWTQQLDPQADNMINNMPTLFEKVEQAKPFFIESNFKI